MVDDNEVKIGQNKIGLNTTIQINIKTLIVIIGIIMSGLTTLYVNITSSMKSISDKSNIQIIDLTKEVRELKDQDLKELNRMIGNIDGKVEGIYRNLPNNNYNYHSNNRPIENQNPNIPN